MGGQFRKQRGTGRAYLAIRADTAKRQDKEGLLLGVCERPMLSAGKTQSVTGKSRERGGERNGQMPVQLSGDET